MGQSKCDADALQLYPECSSTAQREDLILFVLNPFSVLTVCSYSCKLQHSASLLVAAGTLLIRLVTFEKVVSKFTGLGVRKLHLVVGSRVYATASAFAAIVSTAAFFILNLVVLADRGPVSSQSLRMLSCQNLNENFSLSVSFRSKQLPR